MIVGYNPFSKKYLAATTVLQYGLVAGAFDFPCAASQAIVECFLLQVGNLHLNLLQSMSGCRASAVKEDVVAFQQTEAEVKVIQNFRNAVARRTCPERAHIRCRYICLLPFRKAASSSSLALSPSSLAVLWR